MGLLVHDAELHFVVHTLQANVRMQLSLGQGKVTMSVP
jgi:hypothetical protein